MKLLKWVVGILVCAWIGQYVLALALPSLMMEALYALGTKQQGYNQLAISELPDEEFRTIVRPSPDLLYASCFYNLEDGPVIIEAQIPTRYWSMQFYQMNTDNYAGITNQREDSYRIGSTVNVTLIGSDTSADGFSGEVIQSPTQRGIMLLRASAIGDREEQQAALLASRCDPA
ncbi:Uncharacterised protein [Halioglobus japonicus]|nr:Uncharacterised protein [Halioglobus japonicus]